MSQTLSQYLFIRDLRLSMNSKLWITGLLFSFNMSLIYYVVVS